MLCVRETPQPLSDSLIVAKADRNLENLEKVTGPLGERGPAIAKNIESSITNIDALFEQRIAVIWTEDMIDIAKAIQS